MSGDLEQSRINYQKSELLKANVPQNPIELYNKWLHEMIEVHGVYDANPMTVSTIGADGFPRNRIVLLKKVTWEGFVFYTNYNSAKGVAIEANPKLCLSFFWHSMERQVIVRGIAEKLPENLSDGYFETRPTLSKVGAWASNQSEVVPSRDNLQKSFEKYNFQFKNKEIPRPNHWGGYLVKPQSIEFWQGRPNRLHDRLLYSLQENYEWKIERLAP